MNDQMDDCPSDDELSRAFDRDAPEPTAEHIERLREHVALHTKPPMAQSNSISPNENPSRSSFLRFRLPMSIAAVAAVVVIVFVATRLFVENATASLHDTLTRTREALWIHGSTTIEHDHKTVFAESWCSPVERIVAFRSPQGLHFIDYEQGLQSSYTDKHGKVFRWKADPGTEGFGRKFVHAVLNGQDLKSSFPLHDVSEVKKSIVNIDGKSATQYSFHVRLKSNPDVGWETLVRTYPATGRIRLWEDDHSSGMHVTTRFDYPDDGPRSIHALGAPSDAEIIELATPDKELFGK